MSLNSTGVQQRLQTDGLSAAGDPQGLETTNEELKQELSFVKAEVELKYKEMLQEREVFMQKIEQLKRKKEMALERRQMRRLN